MINYSYKCKRCGETQTLKFDRGKAPKKIECACGEEAKRMLKPAITKNIKKKDKPPKNKKIKENLKKRQKKINKLERKEKEHFNKWSKEQTGGRW